jgi:hypothetical protein
MDICREKVPPQMPLDNGTRLVACWLHEPSVGAAVPVELSKKFVANAGGAQ